MEQRKEFYKNLILLGYGLLAMTYVHTIDFEVEYNSCKVIHENAMPRLRCEK